MQTEPHPRHPVAWVALALAATAIVFAGWEAAELRKLQRVNEALHAAPPRLDDKTLASVQQLYQDAKRRFEAGYTSRSESVMFERLYNKARQRHGDITEEERQRLDQPLLEELASDSERSTRRRARQPH